MDEGLTAIDLLRLFESDPDQWPFNQDDATNLIVVIDAMLASNARFRTDAMPTDGTPIYIRTIQPYRFLPYKPNSQQFKRSEKGRWQAMNEYGGWDNCNFPLGNEWSFEHPFSALSPSSPPTE